MSNKSFSLFISLMATIAIWNLSSCDNSGTAASGEDVVTTAHVEEEAAKPGEMAEGSEEEPRAEWETDDFLENSNDYERNLSNKAKSGDSEALKELGVRFLNPDNMSSKFQQNEDLAISLLSQASNKGDAEAQCFLAGIYLGHYGSGKYKDLKEGRKWLEKSAANGFPNAEFRIGYDYAFGDDGFPQDYVQALKWRKQFAVKGTSNEHAEAQYNVGVQYWQGLGVEQDKEEAMKWFRMAAENGYVHAIKVVNKYGHLYE